MTKELNFDELDNSKEPELPLGVLPVNSEPEKELDYGKILEPDKSTQIKSITYMPQHYKWYANMQDGTDIKVDNEEIAYLINEFILSNPEEKIVCVLGENGNNLIFKVQDKILVEKIKELEKEIQLKKNRIQELELQENSIRQLSITNFDARELEKIVPINREKTRLMDDIDSLLIEIRDLKQVK